MSSFGPNVLRPARRPALILAVCVLTIATGGVTLGASEASPAPMATAEPPSPVVMASPAASPDGLTFPLPESVAVIPPDIPSVALEPESEPSLSVGVAVPFSLGHCGLLSPVDLDGSLWQPVSGTDASGGPIDSDDEIGELINATPGELTLVSEDRAVWRSITGLVIHFERAEGTLDYPLCM